MRQGTATPTLMCQEQEICPSWSWSPFRVHVVRSGVCRRGCGFFVRLYTIPPCHTLPCAATPAALLKTWPFRNKQQENSYSVDARSQLAGTRRVAQSNHPRSVSQTPVAERKPPPSWISTCAPNRMGCCVSWPRTERRWASAIGACCSSRLSPWAADPQAGRTWAPELSMPPPPPPFGDVTAAVHLFFCARAGLSTELRLRGPPTGGSSPWPWPTRQILAMSIPVLFYYCTVQYNYNPGGTGDVYLVLDPPPQITLLYLLGLLFEMTSPV